jgi:hypothetical protein
MFHYLKIPYFTSNVFIKFIYNEYIGPYFLSHVILRFSPVNSPTGDYDFGSCIFTIVSSTKVGKSRGFSTLELSNMTLVFLPPNVTSVVQPLNQGILASFKIHYKKILLRWVLLQYDDVALKDLRKVVPNIRQAIV